MLTMRVFTLGPNSARAPCVIEPLRLLRLRDRILVCNTSSQQSLWRSVSAAQLERLARLSSSSSSSSTTTSLSSVRRVVVVDCRCRLCGRRQAVYEWRVCACVRAFVAAVRTTFPFMWRHRCATAAATATAGNAQSRSTSVTTRGLLRQRRRRRRTVVSVRHSLAARRRARAGWGTIF